MPQRISARVQGFTESVIREMPYYILTDAAHFLASVAITREQATAISARESND